MDRSYPYSRRLLSRARQRKHLAALAAAVLAGAGALFVYSWEPDPISAAVAPGVLALPAFGDVPQGAEAARAVRRIYAYSVVPGGVSNGAELARVIRTDRVVAAHYASFDVGQARAVVVEKPRAVHVSYRKGGQVYWTARKVMLTEGETLLSDGRNEMRARCANRISDVPQYPVEAHQPSMEELDDVVEVDVEHVADAGGIPPHTGQTALYYPSAAPPVSAPVKIVMADGQRWPGIGDRTPIVSTSQSGSSSSTSSRSRPTEDPKSPSSSPPPSGKVPTVPVASPPGPGPSVPPTPPNTEPQPEKPLPPLTPTPERLPSGKPPDGSTEAPPRVPPAPPALPPTRPPIETEPFIPEPEPLPPPLRIREEPPPPTTVPEPGSLWLFGVALVGMLALHRRRRS